MRHLFRPVKIWRRGGITSYIIHCVDFSKTMIIRFFGDPIEGIMISEYHTIHHTCIWRKFCPDACPRLHVVLQVILAGNG